MALKFLIDHKITFQDSKFLCSHDDLSQSVSSTFDFKLERSIDSDY